MKKNQEKRLMRKINELIPLFIISHPDQKIIGGFHFDYQIMKYQEDEYLVGIYLHGVHVQTFSRSGSLWWPNIYQPSMVHRKIFKDLKLLIFNEEISEKK